MITQQLVEKAKSLMHKNACTFGSPAPFHTDFISKIGKRLADELGAESNIVLVGIHLMDYMLGPALKENRLAEHVQMGEKSAKEFLEKYSEVSEEEKKNILYCVREHHGVEKFYSIESEICCNADCYKFLSVEGVIGGMRDKGDMDLDELVSLHSNKAEEKWNALSLDICKKDLESQYKSIKIFLENYKNNE